MGKKHADIRSAVNEAIVLQIHRKRTSKSAIAQQIGIKPSTFSNKLHGEGDWHIRELADIGDALGLKFEIILETATSEESGQ